jgi:mannose-1-phosphate guanylyltransferase
MSDFHAMIMAGGSGTRFWPLSRRSRPKQVLPLFQGRTLLEMTAQRFTGLAFPTKLWVVTGRTLADATRDCLPDLGDGLLLECEARDTAPAVALAAARVLASDGEDAIQALLPADQIIEPVERFQDILTAGIGRVRSEECLLTLGVQPTRPATGYGYIHCGARAQTESEMEIFAVQRFVEKPDLARAEDYLAQGGFYWNSGIFLWRVGTLLSELERHAPVFHKAILLMAAAFQKGDQPGVDEIFLTLPKTSIDYALFEKSDRVEVLATDFAWDDVGSFATLPGHLPEDTAGNTLSLSQAAILLARDSTDNVIISDQPHTIAILGLTDMVLIQTADAMLLCPKSRVEEIKMLVEDLKELGREDLL